MTTFKVGYFVGSISSHSINRILSKALIKVAPPEMELFEIDFKSLPFYNRDFDADYPQVGRDFKQLIATADGIIFITPEYNRSIPGVLKNAIDWASRPYGQNSFAHKPSAVIGGSTGKIGTAVAQQHLRSLLSYCNSPQLSAPEAYIQMTPGLFTEDGDVTEKSTRDFLALFMSEFLVFLNQVYSVYPRPGTKSL